MAAEGAAVNSTLQAALDEINETINYVSEAVEIVNSTANDVVDSMVGAAKDLVDILEELGAAADAMKVLVGAKAGDAMAALFAQLVAVAEPLADKLKEFEEGLQSELKDTMATFTVEREKLVGAFEAAADSVNAVVFADSGNASAIALLGQGLFEASARPSWLPPWLGGAKTTPCELAAQHVDTANRTVAKLGVMLLDLNDTAVNEELGGLLEQLDTSVNTAKAALDLAIDGLAGTGIPEPALTGARASVMGAFSVVDPLRDELLKRQVDVMGVMRLTQAETSSLYCAVQELEAARATACEATAPQS